MTVEDWMFAATLITAMFFVASLAIFVADAIYDKFSGRRK